MTKEETADIKKRWYEANRALILEKKREYYKANKDKRLAYKATLKDDFYTLYYLKEEHYIGVTNQSRFRLLNHKKNGKHILDYEVISLFKTKKEALAVERYMHSIGYNGAINLRLNPII